MKQIIANEINKMKENKLYTILKILCTLLFAITLGIDYSLNYIGWIYGNVTENYLGEMQLSNYLIIILSWILSYVIISIIEKIVDKFENKVYRQTRKKSKKTYFIILLVILIAWLPYVLSYFPGGIFADTKASIQQALTGEYNNRNPFLYAVIIKIFFTIGGGRQLGMELFTVFQVITMAAVIAYAIYWLYKRNLSLKYIVLMTLFFSFFRLIPHYAIAIWKDTPFCIVLLLYAINIAEIVYQDGKNLEKTSEVIKYVILLLLVIFLRNNGIYIVIVTTAGIIFTYRHKIFKTAKKFLVASIMAVIVSGGIQGPIFTYYHMNSRFVEKIGVPLQQICYVVAKDGNITEEQREFINHICPLSDIKEKFAPCIVDSIKRHPNFNNEFLEENKSEFFKVWFEIFLQNPKAYVREYLLNTIGFWDVNKLDTAAYINPRMWENSDEVMEIKQSDYIEEITGHSIRKIITPEKSTSTVAYLLVIVIGALMVIYKKRYKNLLIFLPVILTWVTIMIAAPIAFSFRYVFIVALFAPLAIGMPFVKTKNEEIKENGENHGGK